MQGEVGLEVGVVAVAVDLVKSVSHSELPVDDQWMGAGRLIRRRRVLIFCGVQIRKSLCQ